jgi:hypothetical protein
MLRLGFRRGDPLTGSEIHDRGSDDYVGANFDAAVGLVLATAQFTLDADVRALLEARGVFGELSPSLNPVPFRAVLALIALHLRRLGREGEGGNRLAVRGVGGFGLAAEVANKFNAIDYLFDPFVPICLGRTKARGRHSQAEVKATEPRGADGGAFSEGQAEDFGALVCSRGIRNPELETEAGVPA